MIVAVILVVALAVFIILFERPIRGALEQMERERNIQNHRVRLVHDAAGNKWYPHEMADGSVRWYRVAHDHAVDL